MYVKGKKRKTSSSLITSIVLSFVFLGCFIAFFIVSGISLDSSAISMRFNAFGYLFNFLYPAVLEITGLEPFWVGYILCGLTYVFVSLSAVYLVLGILMTIFKKRPILINGIAIGLLGAFAFMITAASYYEFIAVFKSVGSAPNMLVVPMIFDILTIVFGILVAIFSIVTFFKCINEARFNPGFHDPEEKNQQNPYPFPNGPQVLRAYPNGQQPYGQPMYRPLPENQQKSGNDKEEMKSMLREVVRDIVRDEIARNNANQPRNDFNPMGGGTLTGATFGGPLVVQYFNGGINSPGQSAPEQKVAEPAPQSEPAPQPEEEPQPEPEPVVEPEQQSELEPQPEASPEAEQEPAPEAAPFVEPEPISEPAPVVEPAPAPQPQPEPLPEPAPAPVYQEPAPQPEPAPVYEQPVYPFCPQCGQPVDPSAVFCSNCGYRLKQPVPAPAPVYIEPQPAPAPQPTPEPAPVVEPAPAQEEEKKPIIRIPFTERMINADEEMKKNYNELKNEILSYGVNSRVSNSGDTFRLHRKTYVKITIAGLSLKLYFALEPDDYKDSSIPVQNAGHKGIYNEIPLVFKVRSGLSMRRCKELIQDVMEKDGLEQGEVGTLDWVEDLRTSQNVDEDDEQ